FLSACSWLRTVIRLTPSPTRRSSELGGTDHQIDDQGARLDLRSNGSTRVTDQWPQLENIHPAQLLAEDLHLSLRGMQLAESHVQQSGLARTVGPEHHPTLALLDRPIDVAQQLRVAASNRDPVQAQNPPLHRPPSHHVPRRCTGRPTLRQCNSRPHRSSPGAMPGSPDTSDWTTPLTPSNAAAAPTWSGQYPQATYRSTMTSRCVWHWYNFVVLVCPCSVWHCPPGET